jgi:ferredoxin
MDTARALLVEMGFDLANLHAESFGGVRSALAQPAPEGATPPDPQDAISLPISVEFARSGKRARTSRTLPLLDLAEAHDIDINYACRIGNCGACKVKLLKGEVTGNEADGLTSSERKQGYVLTCTAQPTTDCILDA